MSTMLVALGVGFIVGWAAHHLDKRIYAEARTNFKVDQLAAELWACQQELAEVEAARAAAIPAQSTVHLCLPALPQGWPSGWPPMPVIDTLPASAMKEIR
ncbi:MAG: hypothetical protein ACRDTH_08935 [Pseudonocardiaceae bacterium]